MASGNMKDIKRRIKSVESTKQITKAMQLVASSKLRKAKDKAESSKPYFDALYQTMVEIQSENKDFFSEFHSAAKSDKTLYIVIAGDRGLAGGFNSSIFKLSEEHITESGKNKALVLTIGKKSVEYFKKRGYTIYNEYPGIAESIKMPMATHIANSLTEDFKAGKFGRIEIFYTTYVSPLTQTALHKGILPVQIPDGIERRLELPDYEPDPETVFDQIVPKYIAGILYGAIVESFASEQAARRTAMENATDNADTMISDLSLLYNRARQASITQEITEIIGGSSTAA
jgi:F-type H+-transporting ATPase subunit gamma